MPPANSDLPGNPAQADVHQLPLTFGIEIECVFFAKKIRSPGDTWLQSKLAAESQDTKKRLIIEEWPHHWSIPMHVAAHRYLSLCGYRTKLVPAYDLDLDYTLWRVTSDHSISTKSDVISTLLPDKTEPDEVCKWSTKGVELVSRVLPVPAPGLYETSHPSLQEIGEYLKALKGEPTAPYGAYTNESCGLHIHIGVDLAQSPEGLVSLPLDVVQHLAYILVQFEPIISSLFPVQRRGHRGSSIGHKPMVASNLMGVRGSCHICDAMPKLELDRAQDEIFHPEMTIDKLCDLMGTNGNHEPCSKYKFVNFRNMKVHNGRETKVHGGGDTFPYLMTLGELHDRVCKFRSHDVCDRNEFVNLKNVTVNIIGNSAHPNMTLEELRELSSLIATTSNRDPSGRHECASLRHVKVHDNRDVFQQDMTPEEVCDLLDMADVGGMTDPRGEYGFVNTSKYRDPRDTSKPRTIEFRQHEGTLEFEDTARWIFFVVALVRAAEKKARQSRPSAPVEPHSPKTTTRELEIFQTLSGPRQQGSKHGMKCATHLGQLGRLFDLLELDDSSREYWMGRYRKFNQDDRSQCSFCHSLASKARSAAFRAANPPVLLPQDVKKAYPKLMGLGPDCQFTFDQATRRTTAVRRGYYRQ